MQCGYKHTASYHFYEKFKDCKDSAIFEMNNRGLEDVEIIHIAHPGAEPVLIQTLSRKYNQHLEHAFHVGACTGDCLL